MSTVWSVGCPNFAPRKTEIFLKSSFLRPRLPPLACKPSYSSDAVGSVPIITSRAAGSKPIFMWGTWPYAHYGILYPVTSVSSAHYTHYPVISVPSFPVPSYLRESSPLWRQPSMMEPPVLWLIFLVSDWPVSKYGVREASVICHLSSDLLKIDFQKWKTVVTLPGGEKIFDIWFNN